MLKRCLPPASVPVRPRGFTLIELLVVISIIALLIGILLPALGRARATGRAIASASNLRQWGTGMMAFAVDENDRLPWDGEDAPGDNAGTPAKPTYEWDQWYANAIPPYLGYRSFKNFLPNDGTPDGNSLFVDPAAQTPDDYPANYTISVGGQDRSFFFTYVINSALTRSLPPLTRVPRKVSGLEITSLVDFTAASSTVLMVEKRAVADEIADEKLGGTDSDFYSRDLNRVKADYQRFAARHDGGGHLLFADGHVERLDYLEVLTQADGTLDVENRGPISNAGTYRMNRPDRIWAPYVWPDLKFP